MCYARLNALRGVLMFLPAHPARQLPWFGGGWRRFSAFLLRARPSNSASGRLDASPAVVGGSSRLLLRLQLEWLLLFGGFAVAPVSEPAMYLAFAGVTEEPYIR